MSNLQHGWTGTRLHNIWRDMLKRCADWNNLKYGGRGIKVESLWQEFVPFQAWALRNGYHDSLTLERIDNEKDYGPGNCQWIPAAQQARNRRTTRWITMDGETKSLAEWCEIKRKNYAKVQGRLRLGWTPEEAFRR